MNPALVTIDELIAEAQAEAHAARSDNWDTNERLLWASLSQAYSLIAIARMLAGEPDDDARKGSQ